MEAILGRSDKEKSNNKIPIYLLASCESCWLAGESAVLVLWSEKISLCTGLWGSIKSMFRRFLCAPLLNEHISSRELVFDLHQKQGRRDKNLYDGISFFSYSFRCDVDSTCHTLVSFNFSTTRTSRARLLIATSDVTRSWGISECCRAGILWTANELRSRPPRPEPKLHNLQPHLMYDFTTFILSFILDEHEINCSEFEYFLFQLFFFWLCLFELWC